MIPWDNTKSGTGVSVNKTNQSLQGLSAGKAFFQSWRSYMAGADEAAEGKGTFVLGLPLTHRWPEI